MASGGKKLTGKERADLQRKQIVDKVIEDMDKGGFEWVKPWHDMAAPHNPVTGVTYRGGNRTHRLPPPCSMRWGTQPDILLPSIARR